MAVDAGQGTRVFSTDAGFEVAISNLDLVVEYRRPNGAYGKAPVRSVPSDAIILQRSIRDGDQWAPGVQVLSTNPQSPSALDPPQPQQNVSQNQQQSTSSGQWSPSSAPAAGGGYSSSGVDTSDLKPQEDLLNVPEGGELWEIDGQVWIVYTLEGTHPPARRGWYISDPDDLDTMLGDLPYEPRRMTMAEAEAEGFTSGGIVEEIWGRSVAWKVLEEDIKEQLAWSPMFADPEIRALLIEAQLEGRQISDAELRATEYWRNSTDEQRAWNELVWAGLQQGGKLPAEAEQQLRSNRMWVRDLMVEMGADPSLLTDDLINYLADNFTTGLWTEAELRMRIEGEIDPYSPHASPFAGKRLGPGQVVVHDGKGNYYIRDENGDHKLTGPGQIARFGAGARQVIEEIPEGQHFIDGYGRHYFVDAEGRLWIATGEGQIRGLTRLYGEATPMPPELQGDIQPVAAGQEPPFPPGVVGQVVDLFGGPGGIEAYGPIQESGLTAIDVLVDWEPTGNSALGHVEYVRDLVLRWLGPVHGRWSQRQIEEWAGKLRANKNAEDQLIELLRGQRKALFPNYDENLTYEDIAAPWVRMMEQLWGRVPNEEDYFFQEIVNLNNGEEARKRLMREGWLRGNEMVVANIRNALMQGFGRRGGVEHL